MAPQLKISRYLLDKLPQITSEAVGFLYGIMYKGNLLVVGLKCNRDDENPIIPYSFATEVDLCGVVVYDDAVNITSPEITSVIKDVDITDNPVVISCSPKNPTALNVQFYVHDRLDNAPYETVNEEDIWKQFVHLRLKSRIQLVCDWTSCSVKDACAVLHKKFVSGQVSFFFPKSGVYLMGTDLEAGLSGITGEPLVGELCDVSSEQAEGCSNTRLKKKTEKIEILGVEMFWKPTHESHLEGAVKHAPIINHNKKSFKCVTMHLKIDTLSMIYRETKVINVYNILIESLCRSLKLNEQNLLNQLEAHHESGDDLLNITPKLPIPYHFIPNECGAFITVVYPNKVSETEFEKARRMLHTTFFLPMTKPCFRKGNAFRFQEDYPNNGKLINPHEGIHQPLKDAETSLVQGKYTYYHYMQDNMDDDGWGCAYRSLQTLCSWFWWQGYTEKSVPTHKQIQECLVKIGDKPAAFVNSRQWIGSTEVSFCLETILGIQCRIITVNSGAELAYVGPQLASHFKRQGTPIMIGGGVLAHTILGVSYSKTSEDVKFLILDPHFKGADDVHQVQSKGGCYWKGVEFWKKGAYYNLCLPQLPNYV